LHVFEAAGEGDDDEVVFEHEVMYWPDCKVLVKNGRARDRFGGFFWSVGGHWKGDAPDLEEWDGGDADELEGESFIWK
jgi:hypothetical protein